MKVFGDTVYFIALLSTGDRWHARAIAINRQPPGPLVTTEWVLTEVGEALSQPGARQKFIRLLDLLRKQPDAEIVSSTGDLFRRGTDFFSRDQIKNGR
jgi:predicted nucleic acid-binding protein